VPYVIGEHKAIKAAMDWTEFDDDDHSTIMISLVTSHGRSLPLVWKSVVKSELKNQRNGYEDEVLTRLHECLPEDVKVTLLADSRLRGHPLKVAKQTISCQASFKSPISRTRCHAQAKKGPRLRRRHALLPRRLTLRSPRLPMWR